MQVPSNAAADNVKSPPQPSVPGTPTLPRRAWSIDEIVVAAFAFLGIGGAVLLPLKFYIPPMTISILLATGLAALTYRYLGGIQDARFSIGTLKLGGALGALIGIALVVNTRLSPQMPPPRPPFLVWEVSGQVTDEFGKPIEPLDSDDVVLKPPPLQAGVQGRFKLDFYSWPDLEGRTSFPGLQVTHRGYAPHPVDLNPNAANDVEITRTGQHIEIKRIVLHPPSQAYNPPRQPLRPVPYSEVTESAPTEPQQ